MYAAAGIVLSLEALLARGASLGGGRHHPQVFDLPISINAEYHATISIGTPPQPLNFWMDTGSASIWTYTPTCAASCGQVTRTPFLSSQSSTFQDLGTPESIEYLGGTISGTLYSDYLTLNDVRIPYRQNSIQVDSSTWAWLQADGMLGLGFQSISDGNASILDSILKPDVVLQHMFSVYFGHTMAMPSNQSPQSDGLWTFGGYHHKYFNGQPTWIDVITQPGYGDYELWMANLVGMTLTVRYENGTQSVNEYPINNPVIFDTGSGLNSVPIGIPQSMYAAMGIDFVHGARPLCTDYLKLDMTFELLFDNNVKVSFNTEDMAYPGYTEDQYCWPIFNEWDSQRVIIGTSLLRNMYTIFDLGAWEQSQCAPRIGLAHLKDEYRPVVGS